MLLLKEQHFFKKFLLSYNKVLDKANFMV